MFIVVSYSVGKNSFLRRVHLTLFTAFIFCFVACSAQKEMRVEQSLVLSANQLDKYMPLLAGKSVGVVANQTSMVDQTHLLDTLLSQGIEVTTVFAPEHGFRGDADAGAHVADGKDLKTGIPIISLYGKNKKPTPEQLAEIDILVFDIQDVGARFYTYLSTLHYVMEAAAALNIPVVVLDRPNPNIGMIDGPVLDTNFSSFVGLHPVPIVYGMTIGEYAQMINGEGWLKIPKDKTCDLTVIPLLHYTRKTKYELPIAPSPNLRSTAAIEWYPSLCLFEGTVISVGRGTDNPFTLFGCPDCQLSGTIFTPQPNHGSSAPKYQGEACKGISMLRTSKNKLLDVATWLQAYQSYQGEKPYFNAFFKKLAGNNLLQEQISQGQSEKQIRKSWEQGLSEFKKMRRPYLIYD